MHSEHERPASEQAAEPSADEPAWAKATAPLFLGLSEQIDAALRRRATQLQIEELEAQREEREAKPGAAANAREIKRMCRVWATLAGQAAGEAATPAAAARLLAELFIRVGLDPGVDDRTLEGWIRKGREAP
ncbi:hypothetical protein [Aquimonas voraii]|uniref:hypothetical protein n=1 Tax=Aquimonas voraii TaxID=265719 RepID=UPI000B8200D6|nr:hypothetical protein [Aquimonas voraii]